MLILNLYGMTKLHELGVWFFVRLFISIAGGTLVRLCCISLCWNSYYPTVLNNKLR